MVRPVNPHSTDLIAQNYYTKGMGIKGKSSDWGPHAGTIPVDPRYSKLGNPNAAPPSPEQLRIYENYNRRAVGEPYQSPVRDDAGNITGWQDMPGETPIARRVQVEGPDGEMIDVLGDIETRVPITADYDTFAVGARAGPGEIMPFNPLTGAMSQREAGTMVALNDAVEGVGYRGGRIVHHGPANRFANHLEAADFPITAFTPDGMIHTINDVQQLRDFYRTYNDMGYNLDAMPGWGFDDMPSTGMQIPLRPGRGTGVGAAGRGAVDGGPVDSQSQSGATTAAGTPVATFSVMPELELAVVQTDAQNAQTPQRQGSSDADAGDDGQEGDTEPMSDRAFFEHMLRMLGPEEFQRQYNRYYDPEAGGVSTLPDIDFGDE